MLTEASPVDTICREKRRATSGMSSEIVYKNVCIFVVLSISFISRLKINVHSLYIKDAMTPLGMTKFAKE